MTSRRVVAVVSLAAGIAAGASGAIATTHGARESISMNVGDTIIPRFSIKTDSLLGTSEGKIFAKACGTSYIYLRTIKGVIEQVTADTIDVNIPCQLDTTAIKSMVLVNRFVTGPDGIVGVWDDLMSVGESRCVFVIQKNALDHVVTGAPFTLEVDDTTIAKVGTPDSLKATLMPPNLVEPSTCPDTTIDPNQMIWSVRPAFALR